MTEVSIQPAFGDEYSDGDYEDERFLEAEERAVAAIRSLIIAGGRSDNIEGAVVRAIEEVQE
jgi:hypothetical protein